MRHTMTPELWNECQSPEEMLPAAGTSARKLRLWSAACGRRLWRLMTDPRSRRPIEVAEKFADGQVDEEALARAAQAAWDAHMALGDAAYFAAKAAYYAVNNAQSPDAEDVSAALVSATQLDPDDPEEEEAAQATLLREVIGPVPGRRKRFKKIWRSDTVLRLALAAYETRAKRSGHLDPACLAVLADALEDAGCADTELLNHLRRPGVHVRGCWAVDLVLGKS